MWNEVIRQTSATIAAINDAFVIFLLVTEKTIKFISRNTGKCACLPTCLVIISLSRIPLIKRKLVFKWDI